MKKKTAARRAAPKKTTGKTTKRTAKKMTPAAKPARKKTTVTGASTKRRPAAKRTHSKADMLRFERALLEEKRLILRQGRATDEVIESGGTDANSGEPTRRTHAADQGTESYQREVASQFKSMEARTLREIEEALRRISEGTYGICDKCGKPIPKARLEVVPHAHLCMKCLRGD